MLPSCDLTPVGTSGVFFNYLHLSSQEDHYIDFTSDTPTYRTVNTYHIPTDQHARAKSYSQPVQIDQFHYSTSASSFIPLHHATSAYDLFGCPSTIVEEMWNPSSSKYIPQKSITSTYSATNWGGELLQSETHVDNVTGNERLISYQLDAPKLHIASSAVQYRQDSSSQWEPWKTKLYTYDKFGRVTAEEVNWSDGANIPEGSMPKYTFTRTYNFDATTGILAISTADPLGSTGSLLYQTQATDGPLVKKTSPLGFSETMKYDLLGRVIEITDALSFTATTSYSVNLDATVRTVGPSGYITEKTHDVPRTLRKLAGSFHRPDMTWFPMSSSPLMSWV